MKSYRGVLRWLFAACVLGGLMAKPASAAPNVTAECFAVRVDDTTEAGTEQTWFVFRAVVSPSSDTATLVGLPPTLKLGVLNNAEPWPARQNIRMDRDGTRSSFGPDTFWIAFVRGTDIQDVDDGHTIAANGVGRAVNTNFAVVASEADTSSPPNITSTASELRNVLVYPSVRDLDSGFWAVDLTPVDANGNDDIAPGAGQNGNGLRVDPQDDTRPNDGGGAHRFTWRVRVRTYGGLPPGLFQRPNTYDLWTLYFGSQSRYDRLRSGVLLYLVDPSGTVRVCPMTCPDIDPMATYPWEGNILRPQANQALTSGVIYTYTMEPTEFWWDNMAVFFGGDLQSSPPQFTVPDGLPTMPLGGAIGNDFPGRPFANVYASFNELDSTILYAAFMSPPPPMPNYSTGVGGRAGQWGYYIRSSIDFRPDPTIGNNADEDNFLAESTGSPPNRVWRSYRDNWATTPTRYRRLQDSDEPDPRLVDAEVPYVHPYVTPIMVDGHWSDDLVENRNLQKPPNYLIGIEPWPPYDDPSTSLASNARRSRVTTKTKVRFQVRVVHVPKGDISGPLTVRVWIGDIADGSMRPYMMQVAPNQGAVDHAQGVLYYYDTVIGPGSEGRHAIYFEADDGVNRCIWPRRPADDPQGLQLPERNDSAFFGSVNRVGRNYLLEPWVNNRPVLANGRVTPTSGVLGTSFTYEVLYRDADNDPPTDAWVIINNKPEHWRYRMTEAPEDAGNSFAQGRRYRLVLNQLPGVPLNKYNFYFQFRDNWATANRPIRREFGEWVTFPQGDDSGNPSNVIEGPTIIANSAPELREVSAAGSDTAFNSATKYDFFARYRDADNNAPNSLKIFIELYDTATGARLTTDPGTSMVPSETGTNYASGVQYHLTAPIRLAPSGIGQEYRFRFATSDGVDQTAVVTVGTGATSAQLNTGRVLRMVAPNVYDDPAATRAWLNDATLFVWLTGAGGTTTLLPPSDYTVDAAAGRLTIPSATATDVVRVSYRYEQTVGPVVNENVVPVLALPDPYDKPLNYKTISQTVGDTATVFQFMVDYTDADNQPPVLDDGVTEGIYLVVDNTTRVPLSRDAATPTPVDYRTKVRYVGSTSLPIGHHVYHFEATDGAGVGRRPLLADDVDGNGEPIPSDLPVVVTSAATLTNLTIEPFPKGRSNQLYQFTLTFTSPDDRAPEDSGRGPIELWVSDTSGANYTYVVMTAIDPIVPGAYQNGVRFRGQLTAPNAPLEPGEHTITAGFQGDRTQSYVPFQELMVNDKPVLSNWSVLPNPATASQDVVFKVTYTDAMLGDAPTRIELQVDRNAVAAQPVATPPNPTADDFKAGVVYTWTIPGTTIGVGNHIYQFLAADDTEPADSVPPTPADFVVNGAGVMTLSDGTVTPTQGNQANTYVYSVKYTHSDNIAPYRIQVIVNPDGVPLIYDLKPAAGDPLDYLTGVVYESDPQRLPPGMHAFKFEAQDRATTVQLPESGQFDGPKVNFPPELSSVEVTKVGAATVHTVDGGNQLVPQLVGTLNDRYTFKITYKDVDQNNPAVPEADHYVNLIVNNGTPIPMAATGNDYANGVVYQVEMSNLDPGDIVFHFEAFDGPGAMGDIVRFPLEGNITNMSVRNVPQLSAPGPADPNTNDGTLDPLAGIRSTIYKYRVKYAHLDNTAPQTIQMTIDAGTATEKVVDLVPQGAGPHDYRTGVTYGYDTTSGELAVGAHTYSFRATDGLTDVGPLNYNGPTVSNAMLALSAPVDGTLSPQTGPPSTDFTYQVLYTNADNNAPQYVRVMIDGVAQEMTRATTSTNYRTGVLYELKYRFPREEKQRVHTYRFEAQDTVSPAVVRYPAAGDLAGPTLKTAYFVATGVLQPPGGVGDPIVVGGTVTVNGRLDTNTVIGAQQVAVQLVKPDGSGATESVTSQADGVLTFASTTVLDQTGDWKAKLDWAGIPTEYDAASIEIPFKVTGVAVALQAGQLDMIALPVVPVTPDPSLTFNPTRADGSTAPVSVLDLVVWSPTVPPSGKYVSLNRDANFPGAGGGRGYWTLPAENVTLAPRGKLWNQTSPYTIGVAPGWNMIGSVFNQDIAWGAVQVRYQGNLLPLSSASNVIRPYAWGYNPATGGYTLIQSGGVLKPGRGYWVRVLEPCEIILPTPGSKAAAITREADVKANAIQVVARLGNRMDADNYLSLASVSGRAPIEKPPFMGEYAAIHAVAASEVAAAVSGRAGQTVLAFDAVTNVANADITVTFPNVAELGRRNEITLVDLATKTTRALATSGTYTYNSGENASPRRFAILVRPVAANSRLVISDVRTTGRSAGSMSFSFTLSNAATVRAQIIGASGNLVRSLSQGRSGAQGANAVVWDGRDQRGVSVPSGTYLMRLTAKDNEGRVATAILPVTVVR